MTTFHILTKTAFSEQEIADVAALEQLCDERDQITLRIGTEYLSSRPGDKAHDFLCYEHGRLIGYLCWLSFDDKEAEINGMVHPDFRRRGVFRSLLQAAEAEMRPRGIDTLVYLIDDRSSAGRDFAQHIGAVYRNAEYTMTLGTFAPPVTRDAALRLRPAAEADFQFMVTCSAQAFGDTEEWTRDLLTRTNEPNRTAYIAELGGEPIAMIRVLRDEREVADIHGFSVLPAFQGRGFGRQILADTVQSLKGEGRTTIRLDVVIENERALALYQSVGFAVSSAVHFYVR